MYNNHAERALLSRAINDPKQTEILDVHPDDFASVENGRIWRICQRVSAEKLPGVIVAAPDIDPSIDIAPIVELATDNVPFDSYKLAETVKDNAARRRIVEIMKETINSAESTAAPKLIEHLLSEVRSLQGTGGTGTPLHDIIQEVADGITEDTQDEAIYTMRDLDYTLGGLRPGTLNVIAGRPGMGKSAFALWLAKQCANAGRSVDFWSLEMIEREIGQRYLSDSLMTSTLGDDDIPDIRTIYKQVRDRDNFNVYERPRVSVTDILTQCRKERPDVVFIDYLQRMTGEGQTRDLQVGDISQRLKALAIEFHIPVVVLSSVNRECEKRSDKKPIISDLRESGAIEYDADVVMMLHRDSYYDTSPSDDGPIEVLIGKNRGYRTGVQTLYYNPANHHFQAFSRLDMP